MDKHAQTPHAHAHAGKTLIEILWEELDSVTDRLMEDGPPNDEATYNISKYSCIEDEQVPEHAAIWQRYGEERGQAQGVAYCIAVLTNPYHVDVEAVRAEAIRRWKERNNE